MIHTIQYILRRIRPAFFINWGLVFFSVITALSITYPIPDEQYRIFFISTIVLSGIFVAFLEILPSLYAIPIMLGATSVLSLIGVFFWPFSNIVWIVACFLFVLGMWFVVRKRTSFLAAYRSGIMSSYIFIFLLSLLFVSPYVRSFCSIDVALHFDAQNFLTYKYGVLHGLIPYRDYFYVYGLLQYYTDGNSFINILCWIYTSILLFGAYVVTRKITKSFLLSLSIYCMLLVGIQATAIYQAFFRYGTGAVAVCWIGYWISTEKNDWRKRLFFIGILTGCIISLIIDQGLYIFIVCSIFLCIKALRTIRWTSVNVQIQQIGHVAKDYIVYLFGCFIGIVPLVGFLMYQRAWQGFIDSMSLVFLMAYAQKVPFFPLGWNIQNLPGFVTIWALGCILFYRLFFVRSDAQKERSNVQIGLFVLLLLVEQKNIMRESIGWQILPVVIMSYMTLISTAYDTVKQFFSQTRISGMYIMIVNIVVGCLLYRSITSYNDYSLFTEMTHPKWDLTKQYGTMVRDRNVCLADVIETHLRDSKQYYEDVLMWIRSQPDFTGSIFSYPEDPIYYLFNKQKPPPYFNAENGTPTFAQLKNISYIENEHVKYIIYAYDQTEIINVPIVVRNSIIVKYIFTRFKPVHQIGNYLILRKAENADDLINMIYTQTDIEKTRDMLMNISFGSIPKIEGRKMLNTTHDIDRTVVRQNRFIGGNNLIPSLPLESKNMMLSFSVDTSYSNSFKQMKLSFYTVDGVRSTVSFLPCFGQSACMVHLDRVPHFYTNRPIKSIIVEGDIVGTYSIFYLKGEQHVFW